MVISKKNIAIAYFFGLILFISIVTYLGYFKGYDVNNKWTIGDWLINYNSGFIRRGLFGEMALYFSDPKLFVFVFQIICYSLMSIFFFLSLKKLNFPRGFTFISITPFLFLFPILDPQGGFRKEIIGIAILAFSCWAKLSLTIKVRKYIYFITLIIFPALILSHEILAIFLPLIVILKLDIKVSRIHNILSFLLLGFSLLAFFLSLKGNPISAYDVGLICEPLNDFCNADAQMNGAISWLQNSSSIGYQMVVLTHSNIQFIVRYLITICLLIPLVYIIRKPLYSSLSTISAKLLFLAFTIGLLSLHFIAIDYGRFLYIWFFGLVFVCLSDARKSTDKTIVLTPTILILLIIYLPLWRIHHASMLSLSELGQLIAP